MEVSDGNFNENELGFHFLAFQDTSSSQTDKRATRKKRASYNEYYENEWDSDSNEDTAQQKKEKWYNMVGGRRCVICYDSERKSKDARFFRFPIGPMRQVWLKKLNLEENQLCATSCICGRHFREDQQRQRKIDSDAIPTLNLDLKLGNPPKSIEFRNQPSEILRSNRSCIVCHDSYHNNPELRLFRFPKNYYREVWLEKLNMKESQLSSISRVCSRHFQKRHIGVHKLTENAIPTNQLQFRVEQTVTSKPAQKKTASPNKESTNANNTQKRLNSQNTELVNEPAQKRITTQNDKIAADKIQGGTLNGVEENEFVLPDVPMKDQFEITFLDNDMPSEQQTEKPSAVLESVRPMPKLVPLKPKVDEYFKHMTIIWNKNYQNLTYTQKMLAEKLMNEVMIAAQQERLSNDSKLVFSSTEAQNGK